MTIRCQVPEQVWTKIEWIRYLTRHVVANSQQENQPFISIPVKHEVRLHCAQTHDTH